MLVDGRNVARSRWPNLADEDLIARTSRWAEREGVETVVVFDGRVSGRQSTERVDERTTVVATGSGSADDWIALEARRLAQEGRRVWLVSSDRGLRARVDDVVERIIGGGSFATRLSELPDEPATG